MCCPSCSVDAAAARPTVKGGKAVLIGGGAAILLGLGVAGQQEE
jgi:hypothetical protein